MRPILESSKNRNMRRKAERNRGMSLLSIHASDTRRSEVKNLVTSQSSPPTTRFVRYVTEYSPLA